MKTITNEQIKTIKDSLFALNIPVKMYIELGNLLDTLPEQLSPTTGTPIVDGKSK